jgi:arylsulfatase A-like enzyme/Flp pilus assembly protein TadD
MGAVMSARKATVLFFALASCVPSAFGSATNILLVTVDTLRADRLSCYSPAHARTPSVDALAAKGVLFENAFAHTPTTLPSHTDILLGLTPLFHGVSENSKARVSEAFLTLAEHLKKQKYATGAFIGAFPLDARFGLDQGFDVYDDVFPSKPSAMGFAPERTADKVVTAAAAWISARTGPWFCWIHLWDPHAPYDPPEPFRSEYASDPYSGEVAFVDAQLAVLFESLRKDGQADRTLVVLTADHGESLGEHGELSHGYFAYNSTLHVPLIIAGPGVRPGRVGGAVSHVDIFPTVCRLLGLPEPPGLQGRSLVPLMNGGKDKPRPIYFESLEPYLNYGCAPLRGFIEGGTKYIDSPLPEVYDLNRDKQEASNLASVTDIPALKRKLDAIRQALAGPTTAARTAVADARTREKLRSLGYVMSPVPRIKSAYGPEDDLKSFLPFQQRLERAILLSDAGRDEESVRELGALIREKEHFAPAYIYLSEVHMSGGRPADALRTLEAGVRANPEDFALLTEYGKALVRGGRSKEAVDVLERANALIDYDPESWDNLAKALTRGGEYPKALEAFKTALALDPSSAPIHADIGGFRLGRYLEGGRNPSDIEQAIAHFEKATALDATLNPAFRGLGYAYRTAGRLEPAIAAWERAIALRPDDDFSTYNLGLLCLEKGDKARAKRLFSSVLELRGSSLTVTERDNLLALIERCK